MRLNKRKHASVVILNMTPMIDVVFLLLIFFMTVSQVSVVNNQRLELPKLEGAIDQQPSLLTINVLQDGQVFVGGEPRTVAEVLLLVADELARQNDDPSRISVVVRADQRGESRTVNELVRALARLDITRVRLAVEVPQG
jgi:biopolymer transport protein ExbD